jgi:hypothetical protein
VLADAFLQHDPAVRFPEDDRAARPRGLRQPALLAIRAPAGHARIHRVAVRVNGRAVPAMLIGHGRSATVVLAKLPRRGPVTIAVVVYTDCSPPLRRFAHLPALRSQGGAPAGPAQAPA